MDDLDWLERKRQEVEADFQIGKISEEKYQLLIKAIEWKKKKSFVSSFKRSRKTYRQLSWKDQNIKNIQDWYENWLISKAEYNSYLRMNHSVIKKTNNRWTFIVLVLWVCWLLFYWFIYMPNKSYITVRDFSNMWDPIQIPTSWWFTKYVEWENIRFDYLAKYIIRWRVVATAQYWSNFIEKLLWSFYVTDNSIRYRDVWIWWGFMAEDDYAKRFTFGSYSRYLFPGVKSDKDWEYISKKYNWNDISVHFSHNHLIPKDDHVKKLLRWIKKWDFVQIKWYLVSLTWDKWYKLVSSLVRDDSWDWACETILVTDVVRLKEGK